MNVQKNRTRNDSLADLPAGHQPVVQFDAMQPLTSASRAHSRTSTIRP
jgi:hypothetical protein